MGLRVSRFHILGILALVIVGVVYMAGDFRNLTGSLTDHDIAVQLKVRADTDQDGVLTAREILRSITGIVRGVIGQQQGNDINGDGAINRLDIRSATRVFRALIASSCGNDRTDILEECDDGNTVGGDGCTATCTLEPRHLACVNYACTYVLGEGSNTCSSDADCGPEYGVSAALATTPSDPISPDHRSTMQLTLSPSENHANMLVTIDIRSFPDTSWFETWIPDPQCEEHPEMGTVYLRCPLTSITAGSPVVFSFDLQPDYFPNCNITPSVDLDVTVLENRAYGNESQPKVHHLSVPLQCLSAADVTNYRAVDQPPIDVSTCTTQKLGNGTNDFYFASAWGEDNASQISHIFGVLTGNAAGHFTYDHQTGHITFQIFSAAGRNFIRDAVWDPNTGHFYLLLQEFSAMTNAFLSESVAVYDPGTNQVLSLVQVDASTTYGYSSAPLRRAVMQNGLAYFFPVFAFNGNPIDYVYAYNPVDESLTEVTHTSNPTSNPLDLSGYSPTTEDSAIAAWKSCFLRRSKVPME